MSTGVLLLEVRVLLFVGRGRISISSGAGSNPSAKKRHDHSCVSCVARLLGGARRAPCRVVGRVLCTYPISSVARGNVLVHVSCTAHTTQRVTQTDQCSVTRPRTATGRSLSLSLRLGNSYYCTFLTRYPVSLSGPGGVRPRGAARPGGRGAHTAAHWPEPDPDTPIGRDSGLLLPIFVSCVSHTAGFRCVVFISQSISQLQT